MDVHNIWIQYNLMVYIEGIDMSMDLLLSLYLEEKWYNTRIYFFLQYS